MKYPIFTHDHEALYMNHKVVATFKDYDTVSLLTKMLNHYEPVSVSYKQLRRVIAENRHVLDSINPAECMMNAILKAARK